MSRTRGDWTVDSTLYCDTPSLGTSTSGYVAAYQCVFMDGDGFKVGAGFKILNSTATGVEWRTVYMRSGAFYTCAG